MSDAWEEYFAGPVPPAEGGVNWEAYSHDELYQMLWQDADVADVSTVATEWAKHHVALTTHAEVLREQCAALRDSWEGPGAEEAAKRLEALAARVEKVGELAQAGGQAAQEAADALAMARAMMPPPPGNPAAPMTNPAFTTPAFSSPVTTAFSLPVAPAATPAFSLPAAPAFTTPTFSLPAVPEAPASSSMSSLQSYMASMQSYLSSMQQSFASPLPTTSTDMGTAFSAVSAGSASFYAGSAMEDQQKAQAVRTMQTYESSLTSSSQMLGTAREAVPAAAPLPAAATSPAQSVAAGVPWQRLVGSAPVGGGLRTGAGVGMVAGGPGVAAILGPGARVGGMPLLTGTGLQAAQLAEAAAARASGTGMVPPVGQRGVSADDEQHENQLPTLDHGLFDVEVPTAAPVIGLTGGHS